MTIAEVKELHGLDNVVKLSWNENLFGPLPGVLDAIHGELDNIWLYPEQPYIDFRNEVAASTGTSPTNILPAHGSLALLGLTASLLLRPGDRVVVPELTYGLYAQISSTRGAVVHRVPMRDLEIDLAALAETAREVDARIAWVCDPNNPTGFALASSEWKDFLDALPDRCVAVVDEAYADFVPAERRVRRELDIAEGRRVIVLRSFSKLYGLAGLRLGYALVDEPLVPYFDLLEEPFNVNCVALAAGCACLAPRDAAADEGGCWSPQRGLSSRTSFAASASSRSARIRTSCSRGSTSTTWSSETVSQRAGCSSDRAPTTGSPGYVRVTVGPSELMERFGHRAARRLLLARAPSVA